MCVERIFEVVLYFLVVIVVLKRKGRCLRWGYVIESGVSILDGYGERWGS